MTPSPLRLGACAILALSTVASSSTAAQQRPDLRMEERYQIAVTAMGTGAATYGRFRQFDVRTEETLR